jgi:hypothetical protein
MPPRPLPVGPAADEADQLNSRPHAGRVRISGEGGEHVSQQLVDEVPASAYAQRLIGVGKTSARRTSTVGYRGDKRTKNYTLRWSRASPVTIAVVTMSS